MTCGSMPPSRLETLPNKKRNSEKEEGENKQRPTNEEGPQKKEGKKKEEEEKEDGKRGQPWPDRPTSSGWDSRRMVVGPRVCGPTVPAVAPRSLVCCCRRRRQGGRAASACGRTRPSAGCRWHRSAGIQHAQPVLPTPSTVMHRPHRHPHHLNCCCCAVPALPLAP